MDHLIIKQIVEEMFDKAKKSCSSHAPNALSKHIADECNYEFNYRTAERAYKRYIDNNTEIGAPIPETINIFCKYLNYDDYKSYVEKNIKDQPKDGKPKEEKKADKNDINTPGPKGEENDKKKIRWVLTLKITIAFALTVTLYQSLSPLLQNKKDEAPTTECMVWAKDHYEKADCGLQLHPKYGTKVIPYVASLEKSMKKLDNDTVDASTSFFSEETGKPLVWYYKTKKGMLEYFTAPGLHPVNGETLKKITEGMIEKYVPIHNTQPDSFISDDIINYSKTDIAILILNENTYDNLLVSNLKANYFGDNSSVIRLRDSIKYQKNFISGFNHNEKLYLKDKLIIADTLVLGFSKYNFFKDLDRENMTVCNLLIELSFYTYSDSKWDEIKAKNITSVGSGYSKTEAKTNAVKKLNYE